MEDRVGGWKIGKRDVGQGSGMEDKVGDGG